MKKILVAAAAAMLAGTSANAAVIINGSFETAAAGSSNPAPGSFTQLNAVDHSIEGWTVSSGSVDWVNGYWEAADGTHSIDLSGGGAGWIEQDFATTVGTLYTVTYFLSGNPDSQNPFLKSGVIAAIDGSDVSASNTFVGAGLAHDNMQWIGHTFKFTATGATTTLRFTSLEDSAVGPALDAVSISPIPEPATWAMMIGGFGLVGASMRRRSQIKVALA